MSSEGGYYNQGYGSHYTQESSEPPRYLHQNYGYHQNQGFVPPYQNNLTAFAPVSEEYPRQPATAPYPPAPMHAPEPLPVMRMPEPQPAAAPVSQEPRVIIVQHPPAQSDCCRVICKYVDWLLTRICNVILTFILVAVLIGLAIWLVNKYRRH